MTGVLERPDIVVEDWTWLGETATCCRRDNPAEVSVRAKCCGVAALVCGQHLTEWTTRWRTIIDTRGFMCCVHCRAEATSVDAAVSVIPL